jgi:hypothetical protein
LGGGVEEVSFPFSISFYAACFGFGFEEMVGKEEGVGRRVLGGLERQGCSVDEHFL